MAVASASTVRLHVIRGHPRFLCPSGFHSTATLGMEPWSLRNVWPIHLQRLRAIVVPILSCWHSSKRSWFEIIWGLKILTISWRFLDGDDWEVNNPRTVYTPNYIKASKVISIDSLKKKGKMVCLSHRNYWLFCCNLTKNGNSVTEIIDCSAVI